MEPDNSLMKTRLAYFVAALLLATSAFLPEDIFG
jgi:hypothetical protein